LRQPLEAVEQPEGNMVTSEVGDGRVLAHQHCLANGGRFIHWLAWDMTPDTGGLGGGEAAPLVGRNDFGTVGYRYRFRLHAVTGDLGLAPGSGVQELERAVAANVLAVAELVGTYQR
jgi:phosphatidylethanolamine-binding protein (PEBP) family uncharacterized protein